MGLKLVVVCPANAVTGGPEAMHQLVHTANRVRRGSAAILYWPFLHQTTPTAYQHYVCPKVLRDQVPEDALVVFPEIWPEMAMTFKNRCALWWLSVDNFGSHGQRDMRNISMHLTQSEYAYDHVSRSGFGNPQMLTDWVSVAEVEVDRLPMVAVNPAKDAGLLQPFKKLGLFNVVELRGMDSLQVAKTLRSSAIYVDFGKHPGRDRLPREAALAGCTVFSSYHGSARYWQDMPLPNWYKFDTVSELNDKIVEVLGRTIPSASQLAYRKWVEGNRTMFEREVESLLSVVE